MEKILEEVRIRSITIVSSLALTWLTAYWFTEELIYTLAKPFLKLHTNTYTYFVYTQSTEALQTAIATAAIAAFYFVLPLSFHQVWSFLIPSCSRKERKKYNRDIHLSASRLAAAIIITAMHIVPNVWHYPYTVGERNNKGGAFNIKLQPRIYDPIRLTLRIIGIAAICSQVPVILIRLIEKKHIQLERLTNNRNKLGAASIITAAIATPPDIAAQTIAAILIYAIIELAIYGASIREIRLKRERERDPVKEMAFTR